MIITGQPVVIALGGNAISPPGEEGNIEQQFEHTGRSVVPIAQLAATGVPVVVTHGNGPQVGSVIRRVELAAKELYTLPLHICVADTQAGMGYMIAQCLANELNRQGVPRTSASLVTTVEVDPADPAFEHPTKPIGRHYPHDEAERLRAQYGWELTEIPRYGWRRVVASPLPRAIVDLESITTLARAGIVLVAAGGGGIPVARDAQGNYRGVEAVIDKDRTSALLAIGLQAGVLLILTGVERVAIHFGRPNEQYLDRLTVSQARQYLAAGQFPAGSMGPKIQAALDFLENSTIPGAQAIITDVEHIQPALAGQAGTHVVLA